jgi:heat-inducible transcriptional repressor
MKIHVVKLEQRRWIEDHYDYGIKQIEDLLETSASLLSILTHYAAVVQLPRKDLEKIRLVELVPLSGARIVVIIVTDAGNVRKQLALVPRDTTDAEREKLAHFLNDRLCGLSFAAARSLLKSFDSESDPLDERLACLAAELLDEALDDDRPQEVFLEGIENIFEEPEFRNIEHLRPVLRVLDEKRRVNRLLEYCISEDELTDVCICIGSENPLDDVRNCSIVASPYCIGDQMRGAIGVIGPTRMRYSLASSLVSFVADQLGLFLTKMSGGN